MGTNSNKSNSKPAPICVEKMQILAIVAVGKHDNLNQRDKRRGKRDKRKSIYK